MTAMTGTWRPGAAVALALATRATAASCPPGHLSPHNHVDGFVKDSYIVTFPGKWMLIRPRPKPWLRTGTSNELSAKKAKRLAADPAVKSIVQDQMVRASDTQASPPAWGLDRVDQRALPLNAGYTYPGSAGQGVTAYVVDSGVRVTHQDFGGRASYGYDAVDGDYISDDGFGHGTHVAATVAGASYGVAKKAKIVAVRVLDNAGSGTTSSVIAGLDWVTQHATKPAVVNMSLTAPANSALDTAVGNSIAAGITYAVAAGNYNADAAGYSPAG
ncbi:S8 family peptidase [Streptomyces roseus]|uniref:S8 family peptidase n=1 Tax=Streptomyces roseus TaxID=66430 RepID=UPI003805F8C3